MLALMPLQPVKALVLDARDLILSLLQTRKYSVGKSNCI